ncbi:MAG: hypothetical protein E3K37_02400 [Candidatus Kuenenia sp.]|nr:hypothetical protein [Candidatus Kuenenia hertensis]
MRKFVFVIIGFVGFCSIFAMFYFFDLFHTKQIAIGKLAALRQGNKKIQETKQIAEAQSVVKEKDSELPQELKELVAVINAWKARSSSAKHLQEKLKTWKDATIEKYETVDD